MASTAREIMSGGVECIGENQSITEAAQKMEQLGVGALPICGEDERLKGMITDRDIVVKVIAKGMDPGSTTAGQLAQGKPVTIGADDSLDELVRTMSEHQVKRLPVIDGHRLVGVVTEADVAANAPQDQVIDLVRSVYARS
jgi:CBS domain-containing protein